MMFALHIACLSEKYLSKMLPTLPSSFIAKVVDGSSEGVMLAGVLTLGPSAFPQDDEVEGVLKVRGGLSYRCTCQWNDLMHDGSFRLVLHQQEMPLIDTTTYTDTVVSEFIGTVHLENNTLSLISEAFQKDGIFVRQVMCGRPFQLQPLDHIAGCEYVVESIMFNNP